MATDNPSPTSALILSDKLMAINHLTTLVHKKLDLDAMNYSSWVYYFSHLCHSYGILDHLVDQVASSSTATPTDPPPKDAKWTKIYFITRSWIFSTLAPSLRKRLVDLNPNTVVNDDVGTFALEGLPSNYETISTVIVSREPFPDLKTVRSLLTTHEMRVKSRVQNPLVDATSASPMVLLAKFNTSARCSPSLEKYTLLPRTSGSASSVPDVTRSDLDMLQSLLAKFGLNAPNTSTPSPPVAYTVSVPPGFPSVSAQLTAHPTYQGGSFPGLVHLGQSPSMPFHPSQLFAFGSQVGDGRFIPVTKSGHSVLSTLFRPLRLYNVLITPNIVKNLISVCLSMEDRARLVNALKVVHKLELK
nr:hybrid signal transduction histidine kinase M [Tanacetum cinerariifolium]